VLIKEAGTPGGSFHDDFEDKVPRASHQLSGCLKTERPKATQNTRKQKRLRGRGRI